MSIHGPLAKTFYYILKKIIIDKLREGYLVQSQNLDILNMENNLISSFSRDVYIKDPDRSKGSRYINIKWFKQVDGTLEVIAVNENPANTVKHPFGTHLFFPVSDKRVQENLEETFLKWLDISTHEPYTQRDQLFNEYLEDVERRRIAEEAWRREAGRRKMRMDVIQRGMRDPSKFSNPWDVAHQRNDLRSLPPEIISEINRHVMTRMPFAYRSYYPIQNTGSPWLYPKF